MTTKRLPIPNIPAICLNPACNAIFPSQFNLTDPFIILVACDAGRCPRCGSKGRIPDGAYEIFGNDILAMLFNAEDETVINKSITLITQYIAGNRKPSEIIKKAKKEVPELQTLWDLIPRTRVEAYAFLTLLIACLQFFIALFPEKATDLITVKQTIINQTFQNYYFSKSPSEYFVQQESHKEKRHHSKTKDRKLQINNKKKKAK